jgi:chromosome partitioning protein
MSQGWVDCTICAKSFLPRFSYQTERLPDGSARHYCSQVCRMPELRAARSGEANATVASAIAGQAAPPVATGTVTPSAPLDVGSVVGPVHAQAVPPSVEDGVAATRSVAPVSASTPSEAPAVTPPSAPTPLAAAPLTASSMTAAVVAPSSTGSAATAPRPTIEASRALHRCTVCSTAFELRFAYQLVTVERRRQVVCSEACKAKLLEPVLAARRVDAPTRQPRAIAVMNQKGGTGKTTTSVSVAAALAERGHRTLLVDLDAQGNVAVSLGVTGTRSLYHLLVDGVAPEQAIVPARKDLDVITSDQTVAAAELELVNAKDRARVLSRRMAPLMTPDSPYDYVVLDCAPSLSLLNQNALTFARDVIVPVSCDYLALVGVKQILRTLRHVNEVLLHPVEVLGVLPTFYDVRNRISKEAVAALASYFKDRVMPPIRVNTRLKEAPSHKKTIFEHDPASTGAIDYLAVADWVVSKAPVRVGGEAGPALASVAANPEGFEALAMVPSGPRSSSGVSSGAPRGTP